MARRRGAHAPCPRRARARRVRGAGAPALIASVDRLNSDTIQLYICMRAPLHKVYLSI